VLQSTGLRGENAVRDPPQTLYFTIRSHRKTDPMGLVPMVKQVYG
jgi:hypothetical protein